MEKEENEKMKALARYGKEFGGYRMIDVPKPTCGPEDIIPNPPRWKVPFSEDRTGLR